MPIRDIAVTLIIVGSLPFILRRPYIGVLVWAWLSYMNPHRLTWGFAYDMPFAQIVAIVLLVSLVFSKEPKKIPIDGLLLTWIAFLFWMTISTAFALSEKNAMESYSITMKIQLLTFITMMCMTNQKRIDLLISVICLSIGFYSIKGGIFTLLTGGQFRVYGPPNSFIAENNALALTTLMILPLIYYLYTVSSNKWVRRGWLFGFIASSFSVLGSQSRGAFVAILALAGYFWMQSRGKIVSALAILLFGMIAFSFMPQSWHDRMGTIQNYQEDPSAMSRIAAWKYCIGVANERITGGGFMSYSIPNYARYSGQHVQRAFVAHSIYFSVLGAHGWLGLAMYLTILFLTLWNLRKINRQTKHEEHFRKYNVLSRMLTLSLIAYMSGGAFLSLSYFDLPWHVIAIAYLLKHQVAAELERAQPSGKTEQADPRPLPS